ncbi:MYND-type domain-containing protein [Favolaschia claudopus]|uniref:MYND-type domain-containing protein n=1 Tax=Favolaschia claudopus TaxID=2862362 RepID=A0AAW0DIE8_9AGAR
MSSLEDSCICGKPAINRCSACKLSSYCSKECQRADWKSHKPRCKAATNPNPPPGVQVGTQSQLNDLVRIGAQHTIYEQSMSLNLNPSLISGANGADFYEEEDGAGNFWRLEAMQREQLESKAQVHNRKSQRFWTTYLSPITTETKWIDIVLDAILHVRLPNGGGHEMWQNQVNANILAGLFPHLRKFTSAQNTALLNLFSSPFWNRGTFRLENGSGILFAHGKPTTDLIDQLIGRCLSWTRRFEELDKLVACVALPIQKFWPDIAGTRILDLLFVMLSPGRDGPPGGRTVPGDKILEVALTSPAACKHLLPVLVLTCRANMIPDPAEKLLDLAESFGVKIKGAADNDSVLPWMITEFIGDNHNTKRLQKLLKEENEGKLDRFGMVATLVAPAKLKEMNREALERLGNPKIL